VNLRFASTERFKGEGGRLDGDTLFMTVTAWRALAENVAESASKGPGDRDRAAEAAQL
jgi:single-stranded DNA-binding protein